MHFYRLWRGVAFVSFATLVIVAVLLVYPKAIQIKAFESSLKEKCGQLYTLDGGYWFCIEYILPAHHQKVTIYYPQGGICIERRHFGFSTEGNIGINQMRPFNGYYIVNYILRVLPQHNSYGRIEMPVNYEDGCVIVR